MNPQEPLVPSDDRDVEETGAGSFPASDPPAWNSGGPDRASGHARSPGKTFIETADDARALLLGVGMGVVLLGAMALLAAAVGLRSGLEGLG